MSMKSELQYSVSKWRSEDDKPGVFHKESKLSYKRAFLLSLADLDTCKRLPSGFDSSILSELKEASNCLSQSSGGSDSGRWNGILSRHSWQNPESGLLGSGGILKGPKFVAGDSLALSQGGSCNSRRSVALYRPPHLCKMNLHIRRENKHGSSGRLGLEGAEEERSKIGSLELISKEQKAIEEKQKHIPDVQKGNLEPDTTAILEVGARNDGKQVDKCNQSNANHNSSVPTSTCGELLVSPRYLEKSSETRSLHQSLIPQHSDATMDQTKKNEHEDKPADSTSMGKDEDLHYRGRERSKLDPVNGLDGNVDANDDEICWPDEDSLITVDDFMIPVDLRSVPDGHSAEAGLFSPTTLINVAQRVADLDVNPYGEPRLESATSISVPEDIMRTRTSYNNSGHLSVEPPYLQFRHSQNSPGRIESKSCGSSKFVHSEFTVYPFLPLLYALPADLLQVPGHDLYAQSMRFGNPVMDPLSLQMPIPAEVCYYVNGLQSGTPSHLPVNGHAHHRRGLDRKRNH